MTIYCPAVRPLSLQISASDFRGLLICGDCSLERWHSDVGSDMSEHFIGKTQAASLAKLSEKSIERSISRGELTARLEHGRVVIAESDLRKWLAGRKAGRRLTPLKVALDFRQELLARECSSGASNAA